MLYSHCKGSCGASRAAISPAHDISLLPHTGVVPVAVVCLTLGIITSGADAYTTTPNETGTPALLPTQSIHSFIL